MVRQHPSCQLVGAPCRRGPSFTAACQVGVAKRLTPLRAFLSGPRASGSALPLLVPPCSASLRLPTLGYTFDSFAPAQLTLRANLRLVYLAPAPALDCLSLGICAIARVFAPSLPPSSFRLSLRSLVSRTADQTESKVVGPVVRVVVAAVGNGRVAGVVVPATATNAAVGGFHQIPAPLPNIPAHIINF